MDIKYSNWICTVQDYIHQEIRMEDYLSRLSKLSFVRYVKGNIGREGEKDFTFFLNTDSKRIGLITKICQPAIIKGVRQHDVGNLGLEDGNFLEFGDPPKSLIIKNENTNILQERVVQAKQQLRPKPYKITPLFLDDENFRAYLKYLGMAKNQILICVPYFNNLDFISCILGSNCAVKIIIDYSHINSQSLLFHVQNQKRELPIEVRTVPKEFTCDHHFIVLDEITVFTGSIASELKEQVFSDILSIVDLETALKYKNRFMDLWDRCIPFKLRSPSRELELLKKKGYDKKHKTKSVKQVQVIEILSDEDDNHYTFTQEDTVFKMLHKKISKQKEPIKREFRKTGQQQGFLCEQNKNHITMQQNCKIEERPERIKITIPYRIKMSKEEKIDSQSQSGQKINEVL